MPTGKKGVTVYLDKALYDRVAAAAKADRRSIANFIEAALDAVAPHKLGSRVMIASRIAPTPVFDEFRLGDNRTEGEILVWATIGEDRQRFDIPRKVLHDHIGDFKASNTIDFCEQNRGKIEAACRLALSFGSTNGRPIVLSARDFP